ncbi:MAG: hypothetical protein ABEK59_01280 [Halobacteria archaeon]
MRDDVAPWETEPVVLNTEESRKFLEQIPDTSLAFKLLDNLGTFKTVSDLATEMGYSYATIYRYLIQMNEFDKDILEIKGRVDSEEKRKPVTVYRRNIEKLHIEVEWEEP